MKFTTEDAYEAAESGTPIMLDFAAVVRICRNHGCTITEPDSHAALEFAAKFGSANAPIDASALLNWLGY